MIFHLHKFLHILHKYILFEENRGLSAAIKAGFDYTTTALVGYIDADLQTNPEDFNLLLEHIMPLLVNGDQDEILKRARITQNGELTEEYLYLKDYVNSK
mgnify:CR=1 FL=1